MHHNDLPAMSAALREHARSPGYETFAHGALATAATLRAEPDAGQLEDAATIIEYLVGVVDAHRVL
jgi:hypothetical protein